MHPVSKTEVPNNETLDMLYINPRLSLPVIQEEDIMQRLGAEFLIDDFYLVPSVPPTPTNTPHTFEYPLSVVSSGWFSFPIEKIKIIISKVFY